MPKVRELIRCISFYFIIKPQLLCVDGCREQSCISFYFIIKPQHILVPNGTLPVVYHSISSSNHNLYGVFSSNLAIYNTFYIQEVA